MSLKIKIDDRHGLHKGFVLELEPGFTALVGPNGAGKTTLLRQIGDFAGNEGIDAWEYSNLKDGGSNANGRYALANDFERLATVMASSEGECVAINFGSRVGGLGQAVRKAAGAGTPLIVLLDAIDSGASVDRARDLRDFFDMIYEEDVSKGSEVYVVMAVNHYELAKAPADCVDVRTGKHMAFASYDEYANFICSYMKKHAREPARSRKAVRPGGMRPDGTRDPDLLPRD